jgi:hypothetical protein
MNISRLAACCLLLALPALAQLDSAALRAKFGAPLNRETFHMPQGFDLTVDYGAGNQVCKLGVPAEMPPQPNVSGPFNPRQQMQDFLADLVPASMRGKELRRFAASTGAFSAVSWTEYENVTISQSNSGRNDTIAVIFHNGDCP